MELNHSSSVLPTLPGSSDLEDGRCKVVVIHARRYEDGGLFYDQYLAPYVDQFGGCASLLSLSPTHKPLHELRSIVNQLATGYERGEKLAVVILPYHEARIKMRFGDWHYVLTGTQHMFVLENIDTGPDAPETINGLEPVLFASSVLPRLASAVSPVFPKDSGHNMPMKITVSGRACVGKTLTMAVIERALNELWPDKPVTMDVHMDPANVIDEARDRLEQRRTEIAATHFVIVEEMIPVPRR